MTMIRWIRGSLQVVPALLMMAACAGFPVATSDITSCTFEFEAIAETTHGTISIGDKVRGQVQFALGEVTEQGDTRYYHAGGEIKVSRPGHGEISGQISYVHVTRAPALADYVSIGADVVSGGNLGGVERNAGAMLFTLYGKPRMLSSFDLPKAAGGWNAFDKNRVFQFLSATGQAAILFQIGPLSGECK